MTIAASPTESDVIAALRAFLRTVLPTGTEIALGQVNRVPESKSPNYVVVWPLRRVRLGTNIDEMADASFTASIAGTLMTVDAITIGEVKVGATLFGSGVTPNTTVTAMLSGTGAVGTYSVSPSQTLSSRSMASGADDVMQKTEFVLQLDVHGPIGGDNAQVISTLLRSEYGVNLIKAANADVSPLYTEDPRQIPFINAAKQYENRWVVEAHLQANITVSIPQQFADAVEVELIDVDAAYPDS